MEGGLLLDVVVAEGATILELLACEDQALLVGGNAGKTIRNAFTIMSTMHSPLLILDFGLDIVDGVRGLHLEGDGLAREARQAAE